MRVVFDAKISRSLTVVLKNINAAPTGLIYQQETCVNETKESFVGVFFKTNILLLCCRWRVVKVALLSSITAVVDVYFVEFGNFCDIYWAFMFILFV